MSEVAYLSPGKREQTKLANRQAILDAARAVFRELGYEGCSSHSGRRSFITMAARNIHRSGCSLRDVQLLAGHRSIETTERYIDGDTCAQRRLVAYV